MRFFDVVASLEVKVQSAEYSSIQVMDGPTWLGEILITKAAHWVCIGILTTKSLSTLGLAQMLV